MPVLESDTTNSTSKRLEINRALVLGLVALVFAVACRGASEPDSSGTPVVSMSTPASAIPAPERPTVIATATPRLAATPVVAAATPAATPLAVNTPPPGITRPTPTADRRITGVLARGVTDDNKPIDPTTTFASAAETLYLVATAQNLPGETTLEAVWIAERVDADVDPNYVIDRAGLTINGTASAVFTLSKPNAGFPTGSYRVELYREQTLIGVYPFSIR